MQVSVSEIDEARRVGRQYCAPARIVFVVNTDRFFLSHRATWGIALQAAGAKITVIAEDTGQAATIHELGFDFIDVSVGRETSAGVASIANSSARILGALLRIRPEVVFLVHQVAYTVGWPAALVLRRARFIRVAGGVGRALDSTVLHTRASRIVQASGRSAGRLSNVFTLFQLEDDRQTFIRLRLLPRRDHSLVIPGTGIDVRAWQPNVPRDFTKPVVLFASRLIQEKGIYEFVEAAKMLSGRGWVFRVAGSPDQGVESAVTGDELRQWRCKGDIEFLGHRSDMPQVLAEATLFVFPTRHPEGTPKVLIEAGASGLPSVVSGHPGCTAIVADAVTGTVLTAEPSTESIVAAIDAIASDPDKARAMGWAAHQRISQKFSLEAVLTRLFEWTPLGMSRS